MINKALFTSNKEDWETPQDFYDKLNKKFNFEWDLAANAHNSKCRHYFDENSDSLSQNWGGAQW